MPLTSTLVQVSDNLSSSTIPLFIDPLNMASSYRVSCINSSDKSYHFGLYQTFPNSPGLRSVAWKVRGVPPKGQIPSTADIDWTLNYGVAIAKFDRNGASYTGLQIANAQLGKTYQVVMTDGDIPTIDQTPTGSTSGGLIAFKNNTDKAFDMGFAVDGSLVAVQNVAGGETINFDVHPTYYVATYRSIQLGQLVDSGVELGPVMVEYENGYTKAQVEATLQAGKRILKDPVYIS